jgi:hypothetical protein
MVPSECGAEPQGPLGVIGRVDHAECPRLPVDRRADQGASARCRVEHEAPVAEQSAAALVADRDLG